MQDTTDIKTHPLYPYAEFALKTIQHRFPEGAGNIVRQAPYNSKQLMETLQKYSKFSASTPDAADWAALISNMQDGSADIMTCYALGCLRLQYPAEQDLFNCIYINQAIPNSQLNSHSSNQTHVVLLVGEQKNTNFETLSTDPATNALIIDLWSEQVYRVSEFHQRKAEEPLLGIWCLLCEYIKGFPIGPPVGLLLTTLRLLHGIPVILPYHASQPFFQILEDMVRNDKHYAALISSREKTHLPTQSLFALSPLQQRAAWERAHVRLVGYVTDTKGNCHTIRRLNDSKKLAYWNPDTHTPTRIRFNKNSESVYVSDLGELSMESPAKISVLSTTYER